MIALRKFHGIKIFNVIYLAFLLLVLKGNQECVIISNHSSIMISTVKAGDKECTKSKQPVLREHFSIFI